MASQHHGCDCCGTLDLTFIPGRPPIDCACWREPVPGVQRDQPDASAFAPLFRAPLGSFEKDKRHGARAGPPLFAELAGLPAYKAPLGLARRRTNIFLKVVASSVAHSDDVIPPGGQQRLCSGNGSLCSGNGRCARRLYMRPRDPGWCAWMRPPNN